MMTSPQSETSWSQWDTVSDSDTVFEDVYEMFEVIANGPGSIVRRCLHRQTGAQFAVKVVDVASSDITAEEVKNEAEICHRLKHRHIVELLETYSNDGLLYMVFEFMEGLDICREIERRVSEGFVYSEAVTSHYMRQLLEAISYCHDHGIIHRNIQPQFVVLASSGNSSPIKLTGFSVACQLGLSNDVHAEQVGSTHFTAPEVLLHQSYSRAADVWSAGVMLYLLLCGHLPFDGPQLCESICQGAFDTSSEVWNAVSDSAKDLLNKMLIVDVHHRITADNALKHLWTQDRSQLRRVHLPKTIEHLKKFNSARENELFQGDVTVTPTVPELNDDISCDRDTSEDVNVDFNSTSEGAAMTVMHALADGGYSDDAELTFIQCFLQDERLQALLRLYDKIEEINIAEQTDVRQELGNCSHAVEEVLECIEECSVEVESECAELRSILLQPHFIGVLLAADETVSLAADTGNCVDVTPCHNGTANHDDVEPSSTVSRVRLVQFEKNTSDPLGVILKITDEGRCIVGRILHGGMMHKLGTLHVGDEIQDINGCSVDGQSLDSLQTLLRDLSGSISIKIVPSFRSQTANCEIFVRALFDYDPSTDDLISCREAGLAFSAGDILHILAKDDHHWWQARHWVSDNISQTLQLAGLIPSPELVEWKTSCSTIERTKRKHTAKIGAVNCAWFELRKKLTKDKYLAKHNAAFDKLELITYEEVIRLPSFQRKTLVLLGAHGVGRRHIKNALITRHPDCYAYPAPHTSRLPFTDEEQNEGNYIFVAYETMLADIAMHAYLEYGSYDGALYGTKLDTIRQIHAEGLIAVIDVEPQALKMLRTAEYAPYVVFIAAPTKLSSVTQDASVAKLIKESGSLEKAYRHWFDLMIVNNDIEQTIETLLHAVSRANSSPQWIPVSWVY